MDDMVRAISSTGRVVCLALCHSTLWFIFLKETPGSLNFNNNNDQNFFALGGVRCMNQMMLLLLVFLIYAFV
jgi:hypothetical protein